MSPSEKRATFYTHILHRKNSKSLASIHGFSSSDWEAGMFWSAKVKLKLRFLCAAAAEEDFGSLLSSWSLQENQTPFRDPDLARCKRWWQWGFIAGPYRLDSWDMIKVTSVSEKGHQRQQWHNDIGVLKATRHPPWPSNTSLSAQGLTSGGKRKSQTFFSVSYRTATFMSCFPFIAFSSLMVFLNVSVCLLLLANLNHCLISFNSISALRHSVAYMLSLLSLKILRQCRMNEDCRLWQAKTASYTFRPPRVYELEKTEKIS